MAYCLIWYDDVFPSRKKTFFSSSRILFLHPKIRNVYVVLLRNSYVLYSYIQYIQSLRLEHEQNPLLVIHQEACRKIVKQKIIKIFAAFLANFVNAEIYIFFRILHIQTYILPKMQVISKVCNFFFFWNIFSKVRLMLQLQYFRWIAILFW